MKILPLTDDSIREAAQALRDGQLIGLPTETVYGIGASALNPDAIRRTFELKRRPADNPLIVHVTSLEAAADLVTSIPESAQILAKHFWPGAMTLVLPKSSLVPDEATGGLDTVAIRVPSSVGAASILAEAQIPVTAPSANLFMGLSPTQADHIVPEILSGLACVVDDGPCIYGIESTVIDCTKPQISILRPGGISRLIIKLLTGLEATPPDSRERRSPGNYRRHYSPRTPTRLVDRLGPFDSGICFGEPQSKFQVQLPFDSKEYAKVLYSTLHALDQMSRLEILIEEPPVDPDWEVVWDRLHKAVGE
jgi:L-threonylcarbamoyladenylate synthase